MQGARQIGASALIRLRLELWLHMICPEGRFHPRIKSGGMLFGIML